MLEHKVYKDSKGLYWDMFMSNLGLYLVRL